MPETEIVQDFGYGGCLSEETRQVIQALGLGQSWHNQCYNHVVTAITMVKNDEIDKFVALYEEEIIKDSHGKPIQVKTLNKKSAWTALKITISSLGSGQPGQGKTFLAVTLAVTAQAWVGQANHPDKASGRAGESLGFLPAILGEKVDPYLRPVYDALYQILGKDQTTPFMEARNH